MFAVASVANGVALLATNPKSAGDSDGPFYIGIARSLAADKGFVLGESFWPNEPTMGRAPVWPFILSVPARLAPGLDDSTLLRFSAACLNSVSAVLLFAVTVLLGGDLRASILAGLGYALYPVALALTGLMITSDLCPAKPDWFTRAKPRSSLDGYVEMVRLSAAAVGFKSRAF